MDFFDIVRGRHSVRRYQERAPEQEKIDTLLDAVNLAPSAGDLQAYEIVVVRDASARESLARAAHGQGFLAEAPVVLVFCADHLLSASKYGKRGAELYSVQDATIAAAYAELAATALGLASGWAGAFDTDAVKRVINAPEQVTPVAMITVGYASEQPSPTSRRSLQDLVRPERF